VGRRQRIVAGCACNCAVLQWFRFKILSLWRPPARPAFVLLEACRGLMGESAVGGGTRLPVVAWRRNALGSEHSLVTIEGIVRSRSVPIWSH
jgi:hypothetical protein